MSRHRWCRRRSRCSGALGATAPPLLPELELLEEEEEDELEPLIADPHCLKP